MQLETFLQSKRHWHSAAPRLALADGGNTFRTTFPFTITMSDLQRVWARSKAALPNAIFDEAEEDQELDQVAELPDNIDDDSSSASSVSSTGTIIPSPGQKLFARPQGYIDHGLAW